MKKDKIKKAVEELITDHVFYKRRESDTAKRIISKIAKAIFDDLDKHSNMHLNKKYFELKKYWCKK